MAKKKYQDPHAAREAKKYENPVPSRELLLEFLQQWGKPASLRDILSELDIEADEEREGISYRLRAMVRDGQLMTDRRNRYCLIDKVDLIPGRIVAHPDGFGYLVPDAGGDDIFLTGKQMRMVLHGDRVLVQVRGKDRRGRLDGYIVEVIERNTHQIVGRFFQEGGVTFVQPDYKRLTQDVLIPAEYVSDAKSGQIVMVEILTQPSQRTQPIGRITEILGDHMAPGMEIDISMRAHEIPHFWPEPVLEEIKQVSATVSDADKQARNDLRALSFVTIDGADARDFDDAVYCEAKPKGGWKLYVAIADVSHYVQLGTALDEEAYGRGNSVYFPGRVIPMLPEILSNQLCSLNPEVDRLCMVCEMDVTADGKLSRHRFYEAVMHSKARLTYSKVAAMLVDQDKTLRQEYESVVPHLESLYDLFKALHKQRKARGAIEFDTVETRIEFGEDKKISNIIPVVRNDAHRLIEECMLLANVSAAKFLKKHKMPCLYRIHDKPQEEKLNNVREFLSELGLNLKGGKKPHPKDYTQLLDSIRERPDSHLIQTVMLRSLSQAEYNPKNIGHFGLAFSEYVHFTSPIRRYPDLLVHRAIRHIIRHQAVAEFEYTDAEMAGLGHHCSDSERRADEATRDTVDWLKCEYMLDKVGDEFPGIIASVTGFGIFVELKDIYVDGLIHVTALKNDYYHFDPVKHRLRGERTGTTYRLGDQIQVTVVRVNLDDRKIDFELAQ